MRMNTVIEMLPMLYQLLVFYIKQAIITALVLLPIIVIIELIGMAKKRRVKTSE